MTPIEVGIIKKYYYLKEFNIPLKETDNLYEDEFFTSIERIPQHNRPYEMREYVIQYRSKGIKDMYGLSLKEYLALSSDEMELLDDLSNYVNTKENEIVNNIVGEEDEDSSNVG